MSKFLISSFLLALLIVSVGVVVAAKPDLTPRLVTVNPAGGQTKVVIPARAAEVTPGVFSLGTATDKGRVVEGYAFVHYRSQKEKFAKSGSQCGNGICEIGENAKKCPVDCNSGEGSEGSSCYGFLSRGAKWKIVEPYIVDPANIRGLDETFIRENMAADIAKWETAADKEILGDEIEGVIDGADLDSPDNKNEVYFGDIADPDVIGVTVVWGIFSGPPFQRELVEWDQIYDQVDYDWSISGEATKMDFENVATHELGHSVGLDDLYKDSCSEQTMYGYTNYGEINKRTLEAGDIAGVQELYK
jgi:hypothetical protein